MNIREEINQIVSEGVAPILKEIASFREDLDKKVEASLLIEEVQKQKPLDGVDGKDGIDGRDGIDGKDGLPGKDGVNGIDGEVGPPGKDGVDGKDGSPDTPDQVVDKVITSKKLIPKEKIDGLGEIERIARANIYTGITETRARELIAANPSSGGASTFLQLTDTPSSYSGQAGKVVAVNGGETGLTFTAVGGTGTVTDVSVTTANGVSGSVATSTTTPAITLTLGAITPSSVAAVGTVTGSNLSGTHSGTSSGTNTGDQTSIVGITGTKAQFDTAVTDGNILYVGDITQYTDEMAQDAVGTILTDSSEIDFTYNDAAPSITAAIVASSIDESKLDASVNASLTLANSAAQQTFKTIAVSGQSDVVADSATDTLTLVAGTNITLTTNATTDTITIDASGGGGAPTTASYVTLGTDATLSNERVLTGTANQITVTDGGAGGNVTLSTPQSIATSSVVQFSRVGVAQANAGNAQIETKTFTAGVNQGLRVEGDTATNIQFSTFVTGDSFVRYTFLANGQMEWGSGALVADTNLYRSAANTLKTDDKFVAAGGLQITGSSTSGYVWTASDTSGNGSWQAPGASSADYTIWALRGGFY